MSQRPPALDPYDVLGTSPRATAEEILAAYTRAIRTRPRDAQAIHQAQEDLRQPYKRLAVDMLLAVPTVHEDELDALVDEHAELPPLAPDDLAIVLAVGPTPHIDAPAAPLVLAFRDELDDEPIVIPELEP